ncbi:MAG: efflux RND transporter permease subunit, partial [Muribaculaceae bacterium]|nr:efflux RND transporter permease subunit [Muribaculaceae bacterium]
MSLYGSAVKRPIMTTLCFVTVVILGLFSLAKLPVDLFPDIDTNTIMVITMYPGASSEDIEQNVTKPRGNVMNSVELLKPGTSPGREKTSVMTREFDW